MLQCNQSRLPVVGENMILNRKIKSADGIEVNDKIQSGAAADQAVRISQSRWRRRAGGGAKHCGLTRNQGTAANQGNRRQ